MIASGMAPSLSSRPQKPLCLLNIGGGTAIDSLNALILTRKDHPELLKGRKITILCLDLEEAAARFGARALEALKAEKASLAGLDIAFNHIPYDWADASTLGKALEGLGKDGVAAGSSEGALFEYGSDEAVSGNLKALHTGTPGDFCFCGSVTRDTEWNHSNPLWAMLKPRTLETFGELAARAGWEVAQAEEDPNFYNVLLKKRQ